MQPPTHVRLKSVSRPQLVACCLLVLLSTDLCLVSTDKLLTPLTQTLAMCAGLAGFGVYFADFFRGYRRWNALKHHACQTFQESLSRAGLINGSELLILEGLARESGASRQTAASEHEQTASGGSLVAPSPVSLTGDSTMCAKQTVLIVDDDADIRRGASLRLQMAGYDTLFACDGEEGVAKAATCQPDAVLLDVRMPKKDGLAVLSDLRIRADTSNIPVVMISASLADEKAALQLGAAYFLRKPYQGQSLLAAVKAVVVPQSKNV
ncbi:response regulator transcription factor [Planctomicrobium piriforme]|uniref:Response regulator receiver domain-containing protein n=1 Tax=Planctomicrobium piriforme TaxID=1576369 RepID=A0A1I3SQY5_9PLAN|nr:response regulator [Planctomicrobium piriforme]SFJ60592.1 Response regulator receiver domain-containing protein [Planctomicrobium piriforme]